MRPIWIWIIVMVPIVALFATPLLVKLNHAFLGQVLAVAILIFGAFVLLLWGTESDLLLNHEFKVTVDGKRLILAASGGLVSATLSWMYRLARAKNTGGRVIPVYLDGVIGSLCGVVALVLVGSLHENLRHLSDERAAVCGIAGGVLGVQILSYVRKSFDTMMRSGGVNPDETKESS